jgi:tetratricopeptide (TPR) repeat protein
MILELTLSFSSIVGVAASVEHRVTVTMTNRSPISLPFTSPLTKDDWADMQWYLEAYPTQYAADVDDSRADRIVAKLKTWGQGLFQAVFSDRSAERLFNEFQDAEGDGRQITIAASQPEILRLPWELLCDPSGIYLLHEQPRIAIWRQLAGAGGGRKPVEVKPKAQLRLLMVVSRPIEEGISFIDPRAEGQAVLQAIEQTAPGRVVVEFLRPATLKNLRERLQDRSQPVDIVHFDGHGVFTTDSEVAAGKHDGLTKGSKSLDMGYLLFEDAEGGAERVSAEKLGDALNRQQVSLVVLSACQSAMMGQGEDALGCVAAQLTNRGIPAVLAMTYSVLVTTTEQLFGKFYGELAAGQSLGIALANARQDLYFDRKRGLRWRGTEQIELELADWFLPAWYQAGGDITLLKKAKTLPQIESPKHRLPAVAKEGFFGRSRELWQIERAFVQGTRRMTIAGFGGQGKTYLAVEAGRWLCQTGMFDTVCFVDYAAFQGVDAVSTAVSEIGCILEQSFIDAAAVTKALSERRTLIILDNLESLAAETLQELLMVAKEWSQVGATRLLLTTRDGGLSHADYPAANSWQHQLLSLSGLGNERHPEDALRYFQGLMKLPPVPKWDLPERAALIELFKLVDFHPLSIKLVAYQLKERRVGDLARSLEQLLAAEPQADKDRCLVASLNLSLQRLDGDLLALLPRLGVFQGGAWELGILEVLQFEPESWQKLKAALLRTGLVQVDEIGMPFLRFHPTLAPVLWGRLTAEEQGELRLRHQQEYCGLAGSLYNRDSKHPGAVRVWARRELPNLLWAVNGALDDRAENAVEFVICVNKFLDNFGLKRDRAFLTERLNQVEWIVYSKNWYLVCSNQGQQLFEAGSYAAAAELFAEILRGLNPDSSFDRVTTLSLLGRCLRYLGKLPKATQYLQEALKLSEQLETCDGVKRQRGAIYLDLCAVLKGLGKYDQAQQAYEDSLAIDHEIDDLRGSAFTEGQSGMLAMVQGNLTTAIKQHWSAQETFQQLKDEKNEAVAWHHLGIAYQEGKDWAAADRAYRESARISEQLGDMNKAAQTYNQLAILNIQMQKLTEGEQWYRKALANFHQASGDLLSESKTLNNLAILLANQSSRSTEVHQLAKDALVIQKTLDPAAAEIWKTYTVFAYIATAQGETDKAKEYHHLARTTKAAFAGTQYELQRHAPLIELVVAAVGDAAAREQLEPELVHMVEIGRGQLVAAIRRVLAGEREVEALWDDLDLDDSMIIAAILRGV